jgi:hypothetical protein
VKVEKIKKIANNWGACKKNIEHFWAILSKLRWLILLLAAGSNNQWA